jgi:ribosomal protein L7/L12
VAENFAVVSLVVSAFAVSTLLAARTREVHANARVADLEERVEMIAAHVGLPGPVHQARVADPSPPAPPAEAVALFAAGKEIEAIKRYRLESGAGLADAQATLERVASGVGVAGPVVGASGASADRPDGRSLLT